MASRHPRSNSAGRVPNRRVAPRTAADYAKAYYEQNPNYGEEADDDDESSSVFPMWKSVAIAVIVIACFASIYPKIFHPLLMYAMGHGGGDQSNKIQTDSDVFPHASMRQAGGAMPGIHPGFGSPMPGGDRFPSPASRMAGKMPGMGNPVHYSTESTGRTGTWHWLLPFYTIGVVIFLIYTLGKLLWRKPPEISARHRYNLRYNSSKDRFEASHPGMESEEEEIEGEENGEMYYDEDEVEEDEDQDPPDEYPDLGIPAAQNTGNNQLRNLQHRLQETESAMQHILSQLEQLSTHVDDPAQVENVKKTAAATLNNLSDVKNFPEEKIEPAAPVPIEPTRRRVSGDKKQKSIDRDRLPAFLDTGESGYIGDLEKALTDFKRLSDDYVKQHSNSKKGNKAKVDEKIEKNVEKSIENLESESKTVFDAMENDKNGDALTVEPGEGELMPVNPEEPVEPSVSPKEDLEVKKKNVRQRKGRKRQKADD